MLHTVVTISNSYCWPNIGDCQGVPMPNLFSKHPWTNMRLVPWGLPEPPYEHCVPTPTIVDPHPPQRKWGSTYRLLMDLNLNVATCNALLRRCEGDPGELISLLAQINLTGYATIWACPPIDSGGTEWSPGSCDDIPTLGSHGRKSGRNNIPETGTFAWESSRTSFRE